MNDPITPLVIAIDGPAASGKSTLAEMLACRLGFLYFDTGVMYRAVTYAALERFGSVMDEASVTRLAEVSQIDVQPPSCEDGRAMDVLLDGEDVTWAIRTPQVDQNVSPVSAYPGVRKALTEKQRWIGQRGNMVMAGRDIGTVVFPEAPFKIYLDATPEVRALRRYKEIESRGEAADYEQILRSILRRDKIDSNREHAPLKAAVDALIIDTSGKSIDQVLEESLDYIHLPQQNNG